MATYLNSKGAKKLRELRRLISAILVEINHLAGDRFYRGPVPQVRDRFLGANLGDSETPAAVRPVLPFPDPVPSIPTRLPPHQPPAARSVESCSTSTSPEGPPIHANQGALCHNITERKV